MATSSVASSCGRIPGTVGTACKMSVPPGWERNWSVGGEAPRSPSLENVRRIGGVHRQAALEAIVAESHDDLLQHLSVCELYESITHDIDGGIG